jgi:nuclear pore complex protein Nup210
VGDVICFESALSESSNWYSSNERIVKVNANTGVAIVLSNNIQKDEKVTIRHGSAVGSHVSYDLEIRAADKIEFFKTYDIFNGETYRGYLIIKNSLQTDKFTNMVRTSKQKLLFILLI